MLDPIALPVSSPREKRRSMADSAVLALDARFQGCNPIPKSNAHMLIPVVPAKAGTQGFQSLAPGSPCARGRRACPSGGYSDGLKNRELHTRTFANELLGPDVRSDTPLS